MMSLQHPTNSFHNDPLKFIIKIRSLHQVIAMSIRIKTTTNHEEAEISIHLVIKNWGKSWREILILRNLNKRSKSHRTSRSLQMWSWCEGTCSWTLSAVIISHKQCILFDISSLKLKDAMQQTLLKLHSHLKSLTCWGRWKWTLFSIPGIIIIEASSGASGFRQ